MGNNKYWKYVCLMIAMILFGFSVHIARLDALLRRYCDDIPQTSYVGRYGLYILMLVTAIYILYTVSLWVRDCPKLRQAIKVTALAACVYTVLATGYLQYHHDVFSHSSQQIIYEKTYRKGLWYDIRGLFR